MMRSIITELANNSGFFSELMLSHIRITLIAVVIAVILGMAIGILISEHKKVAGLVISFVNIAYTVPSIALLGVLISITGIGNTTAIIALTIYGLLPIVRSTYIGIVNIDPDIIEASEAMGSKRSQILYKIKLPLAFPIIFSAVRNMVTMTIALAGIASFVGAGGLGVAIYRGITTNNKTLLLTGSFLIALLALGFDGSLGILERSISERKYKSKKSKILLGISSVILVLGILSLGSMRSDGKTVIKIGSKPTTEGYILAEIVGQLIEDRTGSKVHITHGVGGGTSNLHPAMLRGDLDMYPEYTGTSWQIVLKEQGGYSNTMFEGLRNKYEQRYDLTWRGMFGFNNTYSLGVRKEIADKYQLKTFSDLKRYAPQLTFGAEYDFFEREDGFDALQKAYDLQFAKVVDMDNGLKYQALLNGKIDVMTIFTTDGQLSDPGIVVLEDDKGFYPSYMAGMVVRMDTLKRYPTLENILEQLNGSIDEKTMAKLNLLVETGEKTPEEAAKDCLIEKGLLEENDGKNS